MASQKNFAITPSVSISRSKFRRPSQHKTSFNLGQIVPIYVDADILPGDTVSLDLASLVRMSTPIAPIMDNIHIDYYAFFVPNRLVMNDWKQFMGENVSSFGAATEPTFPVVSISSASSGRRCSTGTLGDYLGLPYVTTDNVALEVSALPGRAYYLIYNEWFRDQNLITPFSVDKTSTGRLAQDTVNNYSIYYGSSLLIAAKDSDYFTRALPYAQKGSPVTLPLGDTAPLITSSVYQLKDATGTNSLLKMQNAAGDLNGNPLGIRSNSIVNGGSTGSWTDTTAGDIAKINLVADLSSATLATINQLRFAFQYQKFLEKDALYGTRYWEILKGHFGITAPDASLQRPELLGHFRQHINIDQVLQTTGYSSTPANNSLGTPGANSVSGKSEHLISKSFVEHGILMILAVARHDQTYGQGVNRMWSRKHRTDFYFPVFANLGAQEVKNKEIFAQGDTADDLPFGYQEAWAEYRYKPSVVTGILNPAKAGSLAFWTLANRFGTLPTLSKSFIEQDRTALKDALVTGNNGPDFIADFYFDAVYVRPMPMYSLPGLIDHH